MKTGIAPFAHNGVCLRLLEERDLPHTLAWRNGDAARIWFKTTAIIFPEQHLAWFQTYAAKDNEYVFIVEAALPQLGQASVYNIDSKAGSAEIGRFLVAPEHSGKGYMDAACAALIELSQKCLALKHLYLEVLSNNHRAIRLYEHHGFSAILRKDNLLRMERYL